MGAEEIQLQSEMQFNTIQDDILYVVLNQSVLCNELTGIIKKGKRPSRKDFAREEDCTIESLPIPSGSVQLGTSNVNIYVPDIPDSVTAPNATNYDANTSRIKQLAGLAYEVLKRHYCDNGWSFECVMQDVIAEPDIKCHRIWLKIRFIFHN
jgi:hypothetical protein